jgi:hypothetical protein
LINPLLIIRSEIPLTALRSTSSARTMRSLNVMFPFPMDLRR